MAKRPGFTNFTFHLKLLHILQTHAPVSLNKFDHARGNFVSFFFKRMQRHTITIHSTWIYGPCFFNLNFP